MSALSCPPGSPRKLNQRSADADNRCVTARCKVLRQLIRESLYVVDERAVADAILAHAQIDDPANEPEVSASLPRKRRERPGQYRQGAVPR
jgi:hypothetical protein